jgi:hypothetical protein
VSLALNVLTGTNRGRVTIRRGSPPPPPKRDDGNGPVIEV